MKKTGVCVISLVFFLLTFPAMSFGENLDVIVMADISWSLQEKWDDIEQYLLGTLLSDVLHDGDTFHLLWFADHSETMITAVISNTTTKDGIRTRIRALRNLQWLFGRYTDLVGGIAYLIQFTETLPEKNKKLIILITDGIQDPPPGQISPQNGEELKQAFLKQAAEIKQRGWSIHILKTPADDKSGNTNAFPPYFDAFVKEAEAEVTPYIEGNKEGLIAETVGMAKVSFPEDLGTVGPQCVISFTVKNSGKKPAALALTGIALGEKNILDKPAEITVSGSQSAELRAQIRIPEDLAEGRQTIDLTLQFKTDSRVMGTKGSVSLFFKKDAPPQILYVFPAWILIAIIVGSVILLGLFILIVNSIRTRGFHFAMRRTLGADTLSKKARRKSGLQKQFHGNSYHSFAVEMTVDFQKRHVGTRNIKRLPVGKTLSVGGNPSAFLIFLVPVPAHIAEISYDGNTFTFTPRKLEFFPELAGELRDCLGKVIKAVSKKGYVLEIQFKRYISPLEELNILFHKYRESA
jgi:hypothetical protein